MRTLIISFGVFFLLTLTAHAQEGQEHLAPFAHGMGRTYAVTPRGLAAAGLNPALLGYPTIRHVEVSVFPVSGFGIDAGASFSQLNSISGSLSSPTGLPDSDRENIVNLLKGNDLSGRADAEIAGAFYGNENIGGLALNWTSHAAIRTNIPQQFLDYLGKDAKSNLSLFDVTASGFDLQAMWYSEYSLSYGRIFFRAPDSSSFLDNISLGGAVKYVAGNGYMRLDPGSSFQAKQVNDATKLILNYRLQFAYPDNFNPNKLPTAFNLDFLTGLTAGSGIGFDAGFAAGLFGHDAHGKSPFTFGLSVTDIGSITWTKHTDVRFFNQDTVVVSHTMLNQQKIDEELKALAGSLDTTDKPFTTSLPTTVRAGIGLDLSSIGISMAGVDLAAAAEFATGLTDVVGNAKTGRFGFGVSASWPSDIVSFRGAVGYAEQPGLSDMTLGLGATFFNRVVLDAGTAALTSLVTKKSRTDAAFSLRVLF